MTPTLTRRGWIVSTCAWLLLCLLQAPPLTVADTKHDLVADPWGFLRQALSPWTDVFPLGQLQNQAYGYLFPQGPFFALLSPLPDWITQRLWWALLLTLAFAGTVKLLDALKVGSRGSRLVAAVLYALSPRILTTLGAISSEAWPVALVPWILLPVVRILDTGHGTTTGPPARRRIAAAALSSAVAVLCLGAVNAVATLAAVLPAVVWWAVAGAGSPQSSTRRTAWRFLAWWIPAGAAACLWWIGPLLILGRYSPPFTDYIESAGITTHWFSLGEILRGTTSWTPFLSGERQAGAALVSEPVLVAGTLAVAVLGLTGLSLTGRRLTGPGLSRPHPARADRATGMPVHQRRAWLAMLGLGLLIFGVAGPFSPVHDVAREFLDGAGAPLRNLHKFDALIHLPLIVGIAQLLGPVRLPERSWWAHPEKHRPVVVATALGVLLAVVTAPAWSGRLAPVDGYRSVPAYWSAAAAWLNDPTHGAADSRTMILPRAASARQSWGNTRDEPAQALLDVPWVVRDAVPLVPPEAIRGLDGVQREFDTGAPSPTLAAALTQQGVGLLLVRSDLTVAADTPGSRSVLRTLRNSPGFTEAASFGDGAVRIFRVNGASVARTAPRTVHLSDLDPVAGAAEVLPRLAAADAASRNDAQTGGTSVGAVAQDRLLLQDAAAAGAPVTDTPVTVTDTPALREHSYGIVGSPDSAIHATGDPWRGLNPVRDYPSGVPQSGLTHVRQTGGHILATSAADDPTSLGGADPLSPVSAAVDGDPATAWYPAPGSPVNQSLTVYLPRPAGQMRLTAQAQGSPLRLQLTTFLGGKTVASSTMRVPVGRSDAVSLPPGDADRVELRIIGAWARAGISELTLTDEDGADITPRRDIVVPTPDGRTVGRWVLGQEIAEHTMRRIITVPQQQPGVTVRITTSDCTADTSVDGATVRCGQTVPLSAGEHEIRSSARRVDLTVPTTGTTGHTRTGGADDRIVVTPTAVNAGRAATLRTADGTVSLDPVTVNGWQQGWIVPAALAPASGMSDAELAAAVTVDFPATTTYRAWLSAGLGAALALLIGWLGVLRPHRRKGTGGTPLPGEVTVAGATVAATTTGAAAAGEDSAAAESGRLTALVGRVAAALAWAGVSWILAGIPGVVTATATVGVLLLLPLLPGPVPRLARRTRPPGPVPAVILMSGALATAVFTRSPWGGGGVGSYYAGDSLTAQLALIVCLTAVVFSARGPAGVPDALSAPRRPRADHHRDTARRAGSSTSE